jgi:hypothetical protein
MRHDAQGFVIASDGLLEMHGAPFFVKGATFFELEHFPTGKMLYFAASTDSWRYSLQRPDASLHHRMESKTRPATEDPGGGGP